MSHDSKIFQRSLSERLPERGHDKLDTMIDQRFGFQNHFRDMNRFGDRSFEPFSPSRLHEAVRSFDFKEIEAKLFDPSMSGEKLQRMAENFNEFRSRFQDQMFRRDGSRQGGFLPDGRNMIQEMNNRNAFFNSRNDNIDIGQRERYEITRNFNSMSMNEMDNFGANRDDVLRMQSRNEMESRNNIGSPDYRRGRDRVPESMSMNLDSQMDIRRNSINIEQNINMRNTPMPPDSMIPRSGDPSTCHDSVGLSNSQRGSMMTGSDREMIGMRQGQRMETDNDMMGLRPSTRNGMDSDADMIGMRQQSASGMDNGDADLMVMRQATRSGLDSRNGSDLMNMRQGAGPQMDGESEMLALRGPRTSMGMDVSSMRMLSSQIERNDVRGNCNSMLSPNGNMMIGSRNENGNVQMDMVDRNSKRPDHVFENRMQNAEQIQKSSDFSVMDGRSLGVNRDKDKISRSDDVMMDSNMNMGGLDNDGSSIQRRMAIGDLCNDMEMAVSSNQRYGDKSELHGQGQDVIIHEGMNISRSSSAMSQQMGGHHGGGKENRQDRGMDDANIDFESRNEDKHSSSPTNLSDPNMIRQRKQRKPANPQHVFMPAIDHYTSFAVDEVEECSPLI